MTTFGAIVRRAAWLFGSRLASQALGIALTVVLAGRLGVAGFGAYALALAIVFVANVVTTFGTDMVLIRDLAGTGPRDRWAAALLLQLVLTGAAIAAIWIVAGAVPQQPAPFPAALRLLSLSLVPSAVWNVTSAILRGTGHIAEVAVLATLAAGSQLVVALAVVAGPGDLGAAAGAVVAAQLMTAMVAVTFVVRLADLPLRAPVGRGPMLSMLRASASVGVLGLLGVVYQRVALIGVAILAGPFAAGWFAGGAKVIEGAKAGHVALYGALYPAMAEAHARGGGELRRGPRSLRQSFRLSVAAACVVAAALVLAGPAAMQLLFTSTFAPAAPGLVILALSILPSTIATYVSLEVVAWHRPDLALRALVTSLLVLLALVAGLVPAVGWIGACWAVVAAESVQAVGLVMARRHALAPRAATSAHDQPDMPILPELAG